MAKLSEEQAKQLKDLQDLADAPDAPETTKSRADNVNITIDLGDETQVRRALKLGLLDKGDLDEFDDPDPDPDADPDAPPDGPRRKARFE